MAWTRLDQDIGAYNKTLTESTSPSYYMLDPSKFYNINQCRNQLGLVNGNDVSLVNKGKNMVDQESELFNITRLNSKDPSKKYIPKNKTCPMCDGINNPKNLKSCNIIQYAPRIDNVGFSLNYTGCPIANAYTITGESAKYQPSMNPIKCH